MTAPISPELAAAQETYFANCEGSKSDPLPMLSKVIAPGLALAESYRKDAERYAFLRAQSHLQDEFEFWIDSVCAIDFKPGAELNLYHDTLDAAIDAEIQKRAALGAHGAGDLP